MIVIIDTTATEVRLVGCNDHRRCTAMHPIDDLLEGEKLAACMQSLSGGMRLEAVAFRLPFGGTFASNERVTAQFLSRFHDLLPAMPLLVSANHAIMQHFLLSFPDIPQIAFFETSFFTQLPEEERYYAIPKEHQDRNNIKRFGAHGIYHGNNAFHAPMNANVISLVFDGQTTVCAIQRQMPVAIDAGCTLLEGIMGRTTPGDVDPGIIFYLMRHAGYSIFQINELLTRKSGFRGLTGYDMSIRDMFSVRGKDMKVANAFAIYERQILRSIGEAIALLGGCDAIVLAGKNCSFLGPFIFSLLKHLSPFGVTLAGLPWKNDNSLELISSPDSSISVLLNRSDVFDIIYKEIQALMTASSATA